MLSKNYKYKLDFTYIEIRHASLIKASSYRIRHNLKIINK